MFRRDPDAALERVETVIGRGTHFNGSLTAVGTLRIDGKVEGQIVHRGDVVIGETGVVEASIQARNVTIAGEVRGGIEAEGKLELVATGKLSGDIKAGALIISEGALFQGSSAMSRAGEAKDAQPRPRGGA